MKIKNKKGEIKMLVAVIVTLLLVLIVITAFMGGPNSLIKKGFTKIREAITSVPEVDPTNTEIDFFQNNAEQMKLANGFEKSMRAAKESPSDICLEELPNINRDGFYEDNQDTGSYNLYIEREDANIKLRLTKFAKLDTDDDSQATPTPVLTTTIENVQPCIIKGASAQTFYDAFINIPQGGTPDPAKVEQISVLPVESLLMSATIKNSRDYERELGINYTAKPDCGLHPDMCVWRHFFGRGDQSTLYVMKVRSPSASYLCFFPLDPDVFGGCTAPGEDEGDTLMDIDCFDTYDRNGITIKQLLDSGKIPEKYRCSNLPEVMSCECGGGIVGDKTCDFTITQEKCECMKNSANEEYKKINGQDMNPADIICYQEGGQYKMTYTFDSCRYMLKAKAADTC